MIKTLLKQVREYKWPSLATPVCMIGEVICEMIIPMLMASIVDNGVNAGNMTHIYRVGAVMVVVALLGLVFGMLGGIFGAKASTGLAKNLRKSMFETIQTFSFANIDRFSVAGLVTRMTTDVTNVQHAYQMILRMAFRAPTTLIIAMIIVENRSLLYYAPVLMISGIVTGLLIGYLTTETLKRVRG